jgi:hypothetical protein
MKQVGVGVVDVKYDDEHGVLCGDSNYNTDFYLVKPLPATPFLDETYK